MSARKLGEQKSYFYVSKCLTDRIFGALLKILGTRLIYRKDSQDSATCCDVWFGESGTDNKTGAGGVGVVEMQKVKIWMWTRLEMSTSERLSGLETTLRWFGDGGCIGQKC